MSEQGKLAKHKSVNEALSTYSRNPEAYTVPIETPMWFLISQVLFETATSPNPKIKMSLNRASRAQKIIADRLSGTRRPGSHPAVVKNTRIGFIDLTAGALES